MTWILLQRGQLSYDKLTLTDADCCLSDVAAITSFPKTSSCNCFSCSEGSSAVIVCESSGCKEWVSTQQSDILNCRYDWQPAPSHEKQYMNRIYSCMNPSWLRRISTLFLSSSFAITLLYNRFRHNSNAMILPLMQYSSIHKLQWDPGFQIATIKAVPFSRCYRHQQNHREALEETL